MRVPIISKKFIVFAGIACAILGAVVVLQLVTYTTSNAAYCLNCHGTGEPGDVRQASKSLHPAYDQVACVECHAKPGQFIPEGYGGGFWPDPRNISDNCRRCHTEVAGKNTQDGFRFNDLSIRIPHAFHLQTAQANCTDCHANIAHDREDEPTNRPRMDSCFTCHQGASRACDKCHPAGVPAPNAAPSQGVTVDARRLFAQNCAVCHGEKGDQLERVNLRDGQFIKQLGDVTLRRVIVEGKGAMPAVSTTQGVNLTDDQVQALMAYVKGLAGDASAGSGAVVEGRDLYTARCAMCHGAKGDQVATANLGLKNYLDGLGDEALIRNTANGKGAMPAQGQAKGGSLSDAQIRAIVIYLKYIAAGGASSGTAADLSREGKTVYAKACAACHGDNGATLASANLRSKSFLATRTDEVLSGAIANGKGNMPPLGQAKGGSLSDAQVKEVLEYMKTLAVDP